MEELEPPMCSTPNLPCLFSIPGAAGGQARPPPPHPSSPGTGAEEGNKKMVRERRRRPQHKGGRGLRGKEAQMWGPDLFTTRSSSTLTSTSRRYERGTPRT